MGTKQNNFLTTITSYLLFVCLFGMDGWMRDGGGFVLNLPIYHSSPFLSNPFSLCLFFFSDCETCVFVLVPCARIVA